ncbi:hypothetical protein TCAL_03025 [Tigriopus californicus]|uniref:Uncharacterized protein n=2 Tax=Tigriopus californicus TaxID=6832 RepID=A0A553NUH1_TIGCA|nr:uncharacterized protein LOC131892803 isoform X2 [Tigriopus californicus]TRY69079.1 hypothetical protein TCAL_03025 [Tigriopus californicus]|eukprot:TCALIF_03025-PA protein Name:"Protein of unknown function" AED:0.00 eAED:0.00 QI:33/0/0.5/1/0/0.5/2/562/219
MKSMFRKCPNVVILFVVLFSLYKSEAQPLTDNDLAVHGLFEDESPSEEVKRAGFVGMRGKKWRSEDDLTLSPSLNHLDSDESKAIQILEYLLASSSASASPSSSYWPQPSLSSDKRGNSRGIDQLQRHGHDVNSDFYKRATSSGFVGMRGKKSNEEAPLDGYRLPSIYPDKRSGFVGMRGKKMLESNYSPFWPISADHFNMMKMRRGGSSGFVGMRGRR